MHLWKSQKNKEGIVMIMTEREIEKHFDRLIIIFVIIAALVFSLGVYVDQKQNQEPAWQSQDYQNPNSRNPIKWYRRYFQNG